jgi:glutaredoxin
MITCPLCTQEYIFVASLCPKCVKVKHYMSVYSKDRVIDILDNVLSRTEEKQDNKIKLEIKEEIENKQYNLRNKQIKRGSEQN